MEWQGFEHGNVRIDNRKLRTTRCLKMDGGLGARYRHTAPAEHVFDGDLPLRCGADVNTVCRIENQAVGLRIQTWRIGNGPERNVYIE